MPPSRMVRVTSVGDPIEAHIIAARLGSEGLLWELRGGVHPYPVGPIHIYVEEHELGVATEIINLSADQPDGSAGGDSARAPLALWLVVLAVVAVAVFGILRIGIAAGMGTHAPTTVPLPTDARTSP